MLVHLGCVYPELNYDFLFLVSTVDSSVMLKNWCCYPRALLTNSKKVLRELWLFGVSLSPRASIRSTTMVSLSSPASLKQMSIRMPIQSLGLNNSRFPSASSILKGSIRKPSSNTLSLSSKLTLNGSMDKPALSIRNPKPNPKPASAIPNPIDFSICGTNPKSALYNFPVDAISIPEGWSNTRLLLPYIYLCIEPEEYGLPPLTPILCDDVDTRYLLEASGNYYLYNHVSDTLYRFDRPTELSRIIPALGGDWKNIKITEMELLWTSSEPNEASNLLHHLDKSITWVARDIRELSYRADQFFPSAWLFISTTPVTIPVEQSIGRSNSTVASLTLGAPNSIFWRPRRYRFPLLHKGRPVSSCIDGA